MKGRPPSVSTVTWLDFAACKGLTDVMFSDNNAVIARALAVCDSCPVRRECLAWTMENEPRQQRYGVAGGMTAAARYRLSGSRPRLAESTRLPLTEEQLQRKAWGRQGGIASKANMSPEERSELSRRASLARWHRFRSGERTA